MEHKASLDTWIILSNKQIIKGLIRLLSCAGCSAPLLFACNNQIFSWQGPYSLRLNKIGIKQVFLCFNICWTSMVVLKPEPDGFLKGLAKINVSKKYVWLLLLYSQFLLKKFWEMISRIFILSAIMECKSMKDALVLKMPVQEQRLTSSWHH